MIFEDLREENGFFKKDIVCKDTIPPVKGISYRNEGDKQNSSNSNGLLS